MFRRDANESTPGVGARTLLEQELPGVGARTLLEQELEVRRSCQASGADPEGSSTAATTEASAQSQTVTEPSSQLSPSPSARTPRSPGGYRSAEGTTLDM